MTEPNAPVPSPAPAPADAPSAADASSPAADGTREDRPLTEPSATPPTPTDTRSLPERFEALVDAVADASLRWLPLTALLMGAPAWTLYPLIFHEDSGYLRSNQMPFADRLWLTGGVGLSVVLLGVLFALAARRGYREGGVGGLHDALIARNKNLLWLLPLPLAPLLAQPLAKDHQVMALFLGALLGALSAAAFYFVAEGWPERLAAWRSRQSTARQTQLAKLTTWAPPFVLGALTVLYAVLASKWSISNHVVMRTGVYDLGIYIQIFWQALHGHFLDCMFCLGDSHVTAHFDPILVPLSLSLLIYNGVETLYVVQSVWLAAAAVPLYLIGARVFGRPWLGLLLGVVYLLHPALHGMNLFDFHSITLSLTVSCWVMYFVFTERWRAFAVAIAVLLLVREDLSLVSCFIGATLIISKRNTRVGLLTIGAALCYFVIVKVFFMHSPRIFMTGKAYNYTEYYKELIPDRNGAPGLILSVLSNPQFLFKLILTETKLVFLAQMFVPVLALPLLAKRHRFMMLYGSLFILLSSRWALPNLHYQYTAIYLPFILVLLPDGLLRAANKLTSLSFGPRDVVRLRGALAVGVLIASLSVTGKFGMFFDNLFFRPRPASLRKQPNAAQAARYAWLSELVKNDIPPDASVSATKRAATHVALRRHVFYFPLRIDNADYILTYNADLRDKKEEGVKEKIKELVDNGSYVLVKEGHALHLYRRADLPGPRAAPAPNKQKQPPRGALAPTKEPTPAQRAKKRSATKALGPTVEAAQQEATVTAAALNNKAFESAPPGPGATAPAASTVPTAAPEPP